AFDSAGIERGSWLPGRGVEENRRTVEAVYGYYGRLFLGHPYLEWAGLAGMIGPAFYAGFRDLGLLPDAVRGAVVGVLGGHRGGSLGALRVTSAFTRRRSSPCRKRSSRIWPGCMRPTSPAGWRRSRSSTGRGSS